MRHVWGFTCYMRGGGGRQVVGIVSTGAPVRVMIHTHPVCLGVFGAGVVPSVTLSNT